MINNKWMENPILSDISTEKMEVLTKILNGAGDMDAKQMLTYFKLHRQRNRCHT